MFRRRKDPLLRAIEQWTGHRGNLHLHCEPGPPDQDPGTSSILRALLALFLLILAITLIAWLGHH